MTVAPELAIGRVAAAAEVPVSVIRYYDEFGLISPLRRVGGKRRFEPGVVDRVKFIRRAQATGFSLDDIKTLLDDQHGKWPELLDRHLDDLRERRNQLDLIIATLEDARGCGCDVVAQCPRISAG